MFNPGKFAGRAALGSLFIMGGLNSFTKAQYLVGLVEPKLKQWGATPLVEQAGTKTLIQANGATMTAAGAALALGITPRLSAAVLLGCLIPTTAAGHAFWEAKDEGKRNQELNEFMANVAVAGGLLYVISDFKGRKGLLCGKACCSKKK